MLFFDTRIKQKKSPNLNLDSFNISFEIIHQLVPFFSQKEIIIRIKKCIIIQCHCFIILLY